jgi:hypothetical protein
MSTFKLLINLPGPLRTAIRLLPLGGGADFLLGCLRCFRRFGRRRLRLSSGPRRARLGATPAAGGAAAQDVGGELVDLVDDVRR